MIDFLAILRTLTEAEVDFVLVGALSAAIQGAQISTFDVDIVHSREASNLARLEAALRSMNAHYRGRREIEPTAERLSSAGHQLLMTDHGPLDVLGVIEDGLDYWKLNDHAVLITVGEFDIRVLKLAEYLRIRRAHPRPRDRARFDLIEAALEEE